jgi:hypothetical protein
MIATGSIASFANVKPVLPHDLLLLPLCNLRHSVVFHFRMSGRLTYDVPVQLDRLSQWGLGGAGAGLSGQGRMSFHTIIIFGLNCGWDCSMRSYIGQVAAHK